MKKTIYLIRHANKAKSYWNNETDDSDQIKNEKRILSIKGEKRAFELSQLEELKDVQEIWCSKYVRTIQTEKYIDKDEIKKNISKAFDERHYGNRDKVLDKDEFWIAQFKDEKLKNENGESQEEVRERFSNKINDILEKSKNSKIAIVTHNACTLFYLLEYCELIDTKLPRKLTIGYKGNILIKEGMMESPSIMKLEFENKELLNIKYITL